MSSPRVWISLLIAATGACSDRSSPPPSPKPAPGPGSGSAVASGKTPSGPDPAAPTGTPLDPIFAAFEAHAATYKEPATTPALVPYRDKDKWGFATHALEVVIPPRFTSVEPFVSGRAAVWLGPACGLIDTAGVEVVAIEHGGCSDVAEDKVAAIAVGRDTWVLVDRNGRPLKRRTFEGVGSGVAYDGLIAVSQADRFGFLDIDGKPRIDFLYRFQPPSEGLIAVSQGEDPINDKWGVIDHDGKTVIPFEYDQIQSFHDGLVLAMKGEKWGAMDRTGKTIVPFIYEFIPGNAKSDYIVGHAAFDKPPSVIHDRTGKVVATLPLVLASEFNEGLAVFDKGGKHGVVDATGKIVIPAKYDFISGFSHGLAWATRNGKSGFIDKTGKVVVPLRYQSLYDYNFLFEDGTMPVSDPTADGETGLKFYIDRDGREYMSKETRAWFKRQPKKKDKPEPDTPE